MKTFSKLLLCTLLAGITSGCDKSFDNSLSEWLAFEPKAISAHASPHGAWGGRSYIEWHMDTSHHFSAESIKRFAAVNHYTYVSEFNVSADKVRGWTTTKGDPIFPLSLEGYCGDQTNLSDDETWK